MGFVKPVINTAITLFILAWILPTVAYADWITLTLAAIVLTVLQKLISPLLKLLFLPINIVTLGFFSILINVSLLWLATHLVPGFQIQSMTVLGISLNQFFSLWLVSILISVLRSLVGIIIK